MKNLQYSGRQQGAALIVGLIMLLLLTLMVTAAFTLSGVNLKAVGNMQSRAEATAAANAAKAVIDFAPEAGYGLFARENIETGSGWVGHTRIAFHDMKQRRIDVQRIIEQLPLGAKFNTAVVLRPEIRIAYRQVAATVNERQTFGRRIERSSPA